MAETETLNTHQEPAPETQEYVDNMVAKGEAALNAGQDEQQEQRPDWLPEKFQDPAQLAQAYAELEKQFSSRESQEEQEYEFEEGDDEDFENVEAADEYLKQNGVDFQELSEAFWENNGLSEEQYDLLEAVGIPSDIVDQYIDGQMAVVNQTQAAVFDAAGGEEGYAQMMNWATNTLSEREQDAYNAAVNSGDTESVLLAVQGLNARFRSEYGDNPTLVQGQAADVTAGAFQSVAEITAAMSDPRYEKDPAYRGAVEAKLQRSSVI
jgi:hypothetical protein